MWPRTQAFLPQHLLLAVLTHVSTAKWQMLGRKGLGMRLWGVCTVCMWYFAGGYVPHGLRLCYAFSVSRYCGPISGLCKHSLRSHASYYNLDIVFKFNFQNKRKESEWYFRGSFSHCLAGLAAIFYVPLHSNSPAAHLFQIVFVIKGAGGQLSRSPISWTGSELNHRWLSVVAKFEFCASTIQRLHSKAEWD